MRVVVVDGEGESRAGGASVEVGGPVVRVERVERGVGRGKPAIKDWRKIPTSVQGPELLLLPLWPMTAPS